MSDIVNPILTLGYGEEHKIITYGYGFYEVIILPPVEPGFRAKIPWKRVHFKGKIKVIGDLLVPFDWFMIAEGFLVIRVKASSDLIGFLRSQIKEEHIVKGNLFDRYSESIILKGITKKQLEQFTEIKGNLVQKILGHYNIKGKKDFKKIIWEILLEDEEEVV